MAENAAEGLAQLREFRPDVVILDYQLPGRNGLDLLAQFPRDDPGLTVEAPNEKSAPKGAFFLNPGGEGGICTTLRQTT